MSFLCDYKKEFDNTLERWGKVKTPKRIYTLVEFFTRIGTSQIEEIKKLDEEGYEGDTYFLNKKYVENLLGIIKESINCTDTILVAGMWKISYLCFLEPDIWIERIRNGECGIEFKSEFKSDVKPQHQTISQILTETPITNKTEISISYMFGNPQNHTVTLICNEYFKNNLDITWCDGDIISVKYDNQIYSVSSYKGEKEDIVFLTTGYQDLMLNDIYYKNRLIILTKDRSDYDYEDYNYDEYKSSHYIIPREPWGYYWRPTIKMYSMLPPRIREAVKCWLLISKRTVGFKDLNMGIIQYICTRDGW